MEILRNNADSENKIQLRTNSNTETRQIEHEQCFTTIQALLLHQ
jgi:hypothetical protein